VFEDFVEKSENYVFVYIFSFIFVENDDVFLLIEC